MRPPFLRAGLPPCLSLVAGWRPSFVSWAPSAGADLRLFPSDAWFERRPRGGSAGPWAPSTWRPRSLGRADRFAWSPVAGPVACGILGWFGGCGLESPAHGVASLPRGRRPRVALQRVSRGAFAPNDWRCLARLPGSVALLDASVAFSSTWRGLTENTVSLRGRQARVSLLPGRRGASVSMITDVCFLCMARSIYSMRPWRFGHGRVAGLRTARSRRRGRRTRGPASVGECSVPPLGLVAP